MLTQPCQYTTQRYPDVEALLNINELVANKDYSLDPQVYAKRKKKRFFLRFSAIMTGGSQGGSPEL